MKNYQYFCFKTFNLSFKFNENNSISSFFIFIYKIQNSKFYHLLLNLYNFFIKTLLY